MKKRKGFFRSKKGFTIVEILAVMVIMAIGAALVLPNIQGMISKTEESKIRSYCLEAASCVKAYTNLLLMGEEKAPYEDSKGKITIFKITENTGLQGALNAYNTNPAYQYYVLSYAESSATSDPINTVRSALSNPNVSKLTPSVDVMITCVVATDSTNNKTLTYTLKGFWFYSCEKDQIVYTYYAPTQTTHGTKYYDLTPSGKK